MEWEANAVQLAGLARQAKARGLLEPALARCGDATRAAVLQPHAARWHPGPVLVEFSEALIAASDATTFELINYEMSRDSFGPILRPMVQVAMTLTGRTPATILARMPAAIASAVRNITCTWTPEGPRGGVLAFAYPTEISSNAAHAWRGAIRFVGELAGAPVEVTKFEHVGQRTLRFTLGW